MAFVSNSSEQERVQQPQQQQLPTLLSSAHRQPQAAAAQQHGLQEKVVAGFHAGLHVVQEKAHAGYQATAERVDTAKAGQAMLSRGGLAAENAIRAKVATKLAAEQDADFLRRARVVENSCKEAVSLLRSTQNATEYGPPEGIQGIEDFGTLADAFEARASQYSKLIESMEEDSLPSAPAMSASEQDASWMMQLKDGCTHTLTKVTEGVDYLYSEAVKLSSDNMLSTEGVSSAASRGTERMRRLTPCC
eukprot:TRINITY_DN63735_c0_g1_i1.p1 TRINITY_DN63735_c0_g1~~TRINITY_DN63735_c0_g1_i1.p1  ORF type:complete len:248 (+),score=70.78 TRINITY_DN63735_c0_g1_i1:82-825(+)